MLASLLVVIFTCVVSFAPSVGAAPPAWERLETGAPEEMLITIGMSPRNPLRSFVGSPSNLYTSEAGDGWQRLFRLRGEDHAIVQVVCTPSNSVYLLTTDGLFKSRNSGRHWEHFFESLREAENHVLSVAEHPSDADIVYVGTQEGLFWSLNQGETWVKEGSPFRHAEITALLFTGHTPPQLFVATPQALFVGRDGGTHFEEVFALSHAALEREGRSRIQSLAHDASAPQELWVGTTNGVFHSADSGKMWQRLPQHGLRSTNMRVVRVLAGGGGIVAATDAGVYLLPRGASHWEALQEGLPTTQVHDLAVTGTDAAHLAVATAQGAYTLTFHTPEIQMVPTREMVPVDHLAMLREVIRLEPTVQEVQVAAIRYADVANSKIARWQAGSRLRALVPSLSLDRDTSVDDNIDLDRGSTSTPDVYILGPTKKSRDHSLSLSWDLADFIWSSDQTSIDSRAKLMVELRDKILSEVTRLYFERRRLQMQLFLASVTAMQEQLDLLLRIDELTAHLDALTGNYLTRALTKRHHPMSHLLPTTLRPI